MAKQKKLCESCYYSVIALMREQGKYCPYKSLYPERFTANTAECDFHGMYSLDILKELEAWRMAKYSDTIMKKLRQRLELDENDTSCDLDIAGWSANKVFRECLMWEGIIGWDITIRNWIEEIYGIILRGED